MELQNDIKKQLNVIEKSLAWADQFQKDSFNRVDLKEYRRIVKKIKFALSENCSAAAYGESQVGKSYLMDSLLGSSLHPFRITSDGRSYSFINEINSSGGNNGKVETTGVITRFTIKEANPLMRDYVRIRTLSVLDLILLVTDSYYFDVNRTDAELNAEDINKQLLSSLPNWIETSFSQNFITEDDILEIHEYINSMKIAPYVRDSRCRFFEKVAPVIQNIKPENWGDLFALLWNNNSHLKNLFQKFIMEFKKIDFMDEVYVPFEAVLRKNGTLLKIDWLNLACGMPADTGEDMPTTDVYDATQRILANNYSKASLSALIAELTFTVSTDNLIGKSFLNHIDLLDFPGARSREQLDESKFDNPTVLASIFRRGKVAYLFKKYSKSLQINSLLFCHHNDQREVTALGRTINNWIEDNIGQTAEKRTRALSETKGISPFFFVATKFNMDMKRSMELDKPNNTDNLKNHWKRFDTVFSELIKPYTWFDDWANNAPFRGVYPLRDYYWSRDNNLFDGYSNDETNPHEEVSVHQFSDYPEYFDNLKKSFIESPFVQKHFVNPEQTWDAVATPNQDGSQAIIRDLNQLAPLLDKFRITTYLGKLMEIKEKIIKILSLNYVSDSDDEKNAKTKMVVTQVRFGMEMSVYSKQEIFGKILDKLMIQPSQLREIAYDIIKRKTEVPRDFSNVSIIRAMVGINPNDNYNDNVKKLCDYYGFESDALAEVFKGQGCTLNDVVQGDSETLVTVADVLAKNFINCWTDHINMSVKSIEKYVPHADEIAEALQTLLRILGVRKKLVDDISGYQLIFSEDDQPSAIAAMASLVLNNFVSTFGRQYMTESHKENIRKKAEICKINFVDLSDSGFQLARAPQSIEDVLNTLTISENINRASIGTSESKKILRKLPLYDNFMRWENFLVIGLLLSSEISNVDPIANNAIKDILDDCKQLYNAS